MRTLAGVTVGIIVPLIVIPIAVIAAFLWYRRKMNAMRLDTEARDVPGVRLTSETLRRLPNPPWRVVYEIRPDQLEGADHIVIGSCGIIAMTTVVANRSNADAPRVSTLVASTSLVRAAVDEHSGTVGARCDRVVKVYWGTPQPEDPPAREGVNGAIDVEGQRLEAWLLSLPPGPPPGPLTSPQVDAAWRALVIGIGRPDPLH
jgi:hypothetical protein